MFKTASPYNELRSCPKCGCKLIETTYVATTSSPSAGQLKRTCERCTYRWHELPLDSPLTTSPAEGEGQ